MHFKKLVKSEFLNRKNNPFHIEKIKNPKSPNRKEPKISLEDKEQISDELKTYVRKHIKLISNHFINNEYCSKNFCQEADKILDKTEDELLSFIENYLRDVIRMNEINHTNNLFKDGYFD